VDLLVFAPIGVAMFAKDTVPTFLKMFAARGHTELEQRKQELRDQANQYRTIGQFAVRYGGPEARRQAEATVEGVRRQAEATVDGVRRKAEEALAGLAIRPDDAAPADQPARDRAPAERAPARDATPHRAPAPAPPRPHPAPAPTSDASPAANGNGQSAAALPIPGYDQLSASQVVARLDGLGPEELQTIRAYETQHRGRNTILGKIAQLSG
jgi:hypothetical protein